MFPNWFQHYAQPCFERYLTTPGRFLQIGAFTGDASVWLLDLGGTLVDVDTWEGSAEPPHAAMDWAAVEAVYDERTAGETVKHKGTSERFFATYSGPPFDFIYIDGDHTAPVVLNDAIGAYRNLTTGGLLAFDDYQWKPAGGGETRAPGVAIDAFIAVYEDRFDVLEVGAQVWLRKTA